VQIKLVYCSSYSPDAIVIHVQREPPQVVVQAESGSPPDVLEIEPRIVINGQQLVAKFYLAWQIFPSSMPSFRFACKIMHWAQVDRG